MKIIFFGTSAFAGRLYSYLIKNNVNIVAVVTRQDKPRGRSLQVTPPPVKEVVLQQTPNMPVYQPPKASTPEFAETLKNHQPDLFVVVAYGEILRPMILQIPKLGCINVHASLLPKYRGAAPMQRCLMNGEKETGVTIMEMVQEMDAGDILEMVKIPVPESMTFGELDHKLSEISGPALFKVIQNFKSIPHIPQNHTEATFSSKITAEEEEIKWNRPAREIHNLVRALSPSPGAWCWVQINNDKKRLKIKKTEVAAMHGSPGKNLIFDKKQWIVACGQEALRLLEVQLEGKKTMPIEEFLRGHAQIFIFT